MRWLFLKFIGLQVLVFLAAFNVCMQALLLVPQNQLYEPSWVNAGFTFVLFVAFSVSSFEILTRARLWRLEAANETGSDSSVKNLLYLFIKPFIVRARKTLKR